ncbi:hypothetical protein [Kitasatospora sp. NPDC057015]|uniref:hypothetical protein n=1 Tax=Kitasatospora sp. NPDC057015 TaxID=3346001 RepID=UPI0036345C93
MSTDPVEPSSPDAPPAAAPPAAPPAEPPVTTPVAAPVTTAAEATPGSNPPVEVSPWAAPGSAAAPAAGPYAPSGDPYAPPGQVTGAPAAGPAGVPSPADGPAAGGPAVDFLAAGGPESGPPARVRRPRPVLLLTSALVLGLLLGGGAGYGIQAGRPPTPLPPLQVALPGYPAAVLDAKAAADAAPKPLAIDGDLRKLVMERPGGTEPWADNPDVPSWISVGELAERTGNAKKVFALLNQRGFRRAAGVDWKKDNTRYRVTLVQFGPDDSDSAATEVRDMSSAASTKFADGVNGAYEVQTEPENWAESTDKYWYGYAVARRGTLVMEIEVFAPQLVDAAALKDLAKKQWERLA